MENELQIVDAKQQMLTATNAAGVSKEIVTKTAIEIQGRKYVRIEGWQAIALAHGCVLSARDVQRVDGGVTAIGEVRRGSDGVVISVAEGFVGDDEESWQVRKGQKVAEYARRAMAQTRAMSRAARSAFAHVVVMMDAGLSTTPAEEVPDGGFVDVEEIVHPELIGQGADKEIRDMYFNNRKGFNKEYPGLELVKQSDGKYVFAELGTYKK